MIKNFERLLMAFSVLAVSAVLISSFWSRGASVQIETTEGTGDVTAAVQTTAPAPVQTTAPLPMETGIVEAALENYRMDETALSVCIYDPELDEQPQLRGFGKYSKGFELAGLCDERRMNPVAVFWWLEKEGLYEKMPDGSGVLQTPAFDAPEAREKTYPNTDEGARELLTDLFQAAGAVGDGLDLEKQLLGSDGKLNPDQVFVDAGECRYAYFVYYGDRTAYFLCCYLRGGEQITDVEFQLLGLRYADGPAEALEKIDAQVDCQAAALMAAAERLLTGTSRADQGRIPFDYTLEDCTAHIERFAFAGDGESGILCNYRIQK